MTGAPRFQGRGPGLAALPDPLVERIVAAADSAAAALACRLTSHQLRRCAAPVVAAQLRRALPPATALPAGHAAQAALLEVLEGRGQRFGGAALRGRRQRSARPHGGAAASAVALGAGGGVALVGDRDGRLERARPPAPPTLLPPGDAAITAVAVADADGNADGAWAAAAADGALRLWRADAGGCAAGRAAPAAVHLDVAADGAALLVVDRAGGAAVYGRTGAALRPRRRPDADGPTWHWGALRADGHGAVLVGRDGRPWLWTWWPAAATHALPAAALGAPWQLRHRGPWLAVAGALGCAVWDLRGTAPPRLLAGDEATLLALSADGRWLATAVPGLVSLWPLGRDDIPPSPLETPLGLGIRPAALALSAYGNRVAVACRRAVVQWTRAPGQAPRLRVLDGEIAPRALAFAADGQRLVGVGDEGAAVWEVAAPPGRA